MSSQSVFSATGPIVAHAADVKPVPAVMAAAPPTSEVRPQVGTGLPFRMQAPAPAKTALPKRVSKEAHVGFGYEFVPSHVDEEKSLVVKVPSEMVELALQNAAAGVAHVDPRHVLVESISAKVFNTCCDVPLGINLRGVDGLVTQSAVALVGDEFMTANHFFPPNHVHEGMLYVADTTRKDTLRNHAKGNVTQFTHKALSEYESTGPAGMSVHCNSPVWDHMSALPSETAAMLESRRRAVSSNATDVTHVLVPDVKTYRATKDKLVDASARNAVHHSDLTGMELHLASAAGPTLGAEPPRYKHDDAEVRAARANTCQHGYVQLGIKFYIDKPAEA